MKLSRLLPVLCAIGLAAGTAWWMAGAPGESAASPATGGRLLATLRSEPRTFNRYVSANSAEEVVSRLTQGTLVRVNRATGALEPRLALDWTTTDGGLTWTLHLRQGVTFSDGAPFSSADVVFSFQVANDPTINSAIAGGLRVGDEPLAFRALDDHTVVVTFPAPYGPGLAVLDGLPILPRHTLEAAYASGEFAKAWAVTSPVSDIVGLGPFVITEYVAGQRLVFGRNARFWGRDDRGVALPYLDAIELQVVPEQDGEILRLQSGAVRNLVTDQVRAEDIATLRPLVDKGAIRLSAAGVTISPDMLWFNLAPGAAAARTRPWLQREELRRAISHAVNRQAIVDTVFLGEAEPIFGPITPGHGEWYLPDLPHTEYDPAKAAALLASIDLKDRNGDGALDDASGKTAHVTLLTVRGRTVTERTAAMIQEQVRKIGLTLDVVPMELSSMIGAWGKGDYDAILFRLTFDSRDPARNPEYWLSSGSFHLWNPSQPAPATAWEAAIDDLFRRQATILDMAERKRLFADAQRMLAAHLPVLYFAAARVTVASSARVQGTMPSVVPPTILWNAEALSLDSASTRR